MISLILCCRIANNENSDLINVLKKFIDNAYSRGNFEILIKFDDDDEGAKKLLPQLDALPANIKYIITPRGEGYTGLHRSYEVLFKMIDPASYMVWVISDDVDILTLHWDKEILDATAKYKDRIFVATPKKLIRLYKLTYPPNRVESYPIWSRKWLDTIGFGPIFITDVWTGLIEYLLFKYHNIDNRILVKNYYIKGTGMKNWIVQNLKGGKML